MPQHWSQPIHLGKQPETTTELDTEPTKYFCGKKGKGYLKTPNRHSQFGASNK